MQKEIPLDLKISRERSGLSGNDLGHLLGCEKDRVSRLEHGKARISTSEIVSLCVIYGKSVEDVFHELSTQILSTLRLRLADMPPESANWERKHKERLDTLNGLTFRLTELTNITHEV